ncbi:MAG: hemolysin family protein [Deinococcota bacterium]
MRWQVLVAVVVGMVLLTASVFAQPIASNEGVSNIAVLMLVVMLLLSGFFSGSETSFTAVSKWKIRELAEQGKSVYVLLDRDPTRFITTCLIGSNLANIAATALVTQIAVGLADRWSLSEGLVITYTTALMTLLVLVVGEITPKAIAVYHADRFAGIAIRPIHALSVFLYPVGLFFTYVSSSILRVFGLEPRESPLVTETELRLMLRSAEESGVIETHERDMIRGVIELEETVVREVMTPRVDIIALPEDASLKTLLERTTEHGYSRLPIYQENVDNIRGIAYARDLLKYLGSDEDLTTITVDSIMQTPQYVPETLAILHLMRDMRLRKNHMAIIVDEFGGTAGLVTLEDIIEEITGEIYDETDADEDEDILNLGEGDYRVSGSADIDDVGDKLDIQLDEQGDYDTLAGFMIEEFDRIPERGESLEYEGYQFTVEEADERRIMSVLVSELMVEEDIEDEVDETDVARDNSRDAVNTVRD